MKKIQIKIILGFMITFLTNACIAQNNWNNTSSENDILRDTILKKGTTLVFISKDSTFDKATQENLINTFFIVYPKEVKEYNPNSLKKVVMIIDPDYDGVAATDNGIVRISPRWLHLHPQDIDVVTHEVMHIVQAYPHGAGPGWITEGIADYVRDKFGVNNEEGGWNLPAYSNKQNYTNAYRVTARFFIWAENNYDKDLVKKLNAVMRNKKYSPGFWQKETGKTIDELWNTYGENPSISK